MTRLPRCPGELKGRAKTLRRTSLRLGAKRIGNADAGIESTLSAILDVERLERMSDRLLDALSCEDLFATE